MKNLTLFCLFFDRSQDRSSDSDTERRRGAPTAPSAEKRRPRLSISSSDDERPTSKNNDASDDDSRWRRVPVKRSKIAESPTKKSEKKKSPAKSKSRRPRSRVTNTSGCASDSDSESEVALRNNRIQVARVPPRPRAPLTRATSPDNSDSDNSPAPKLQEEDGGNVQDKKKSDTLRKLFSSSKGGAKGGGKGGKGGKGGGKCGIYVEEYTGSANTPTGSESPYKRPSSQASSATTFPPLVYVNGVPSLLCRLDLNKIPHIPQPSRGQELRQRTELPDTRPPSRPSSRTSSRPSSRQASSRPSSRQAASNAASATVPRPSTPEEGEIVETPRPPSSAESRIHGESSAVKVEPEEASAKSKRSVVKNEIVETDSKNHPVASGSGSNNGSNGSGSAATNSSAAAGVSVASGSGASVVPPAAGISGSAPKRKRNLSCSSVSGMSVCSVDTKGKHHGQHKEKKKRKRKHADKESPPARPSSSLVSLENIYLFLNLFLLTTIQTSVEFMYFFCALIDEAMSMKKKSGV